MVIWEGRVAAEVDLSFLHDVLMRESFPTVRSPPRSRTGYRGTRQLRATTGQSRLMVGVGKSIISSVKRKNGSARYSYLGHGHPSPISAT